jgi:hypothetical protein
LDNALNYFHRRDAEHAEKKRVVFLPGLGDGNPGKPSRYAGGSVFSLPDFSGDEKGRSSSLRPLRLCGEIMEVPLRGRGSATATVKIVGDL